MGRAGMGVHSDVWHCHSLRMVVGTIECGDVGTHAALVRRNHEESGRLRRHRTTRTAG